MVKKFIFVFKTHFDIGFTDLAENVIRGYGDAMLKEVIETCNATADMGKLRYVWTMPAWPLWYITKNCNPALKPELDRLIREGQIVWHGLPFTSHTDFAAPDEYAETFRYSRELAKAYQKPMPVAAKMTDVPGHGFMLPDVLDQAGIHFLHLGCNEFATPPDVPELFFWEGPGGGTVLTMYSKGGYGTGLFPPKDWPYPVWMALMHTHDNSGPQSASAIKKMVAQIHEEYPDAEIICGTMDDFYREMAQCDLSDIPVLKKDLADTWIHGVGSYPAEVSLVRQCRERARALHLVYFNQLMKKGDSNAPAIEQLWNQYYEEIALFEEHTWGADVKTWLGSDRVYEKEAFLQAKNEPRYQFMEKSWNEQLGRAKRAAQCLDQIEALLGVIDSASASVKSSSESSAEKLLENDFHDFTNALQLTTVGDLMIASSHRYQMIFNSQNGKIQSVYDRKNKKTILQAGEQGLFTYRYDRYGFDDINEFLRTYGYHFLTWGIQDYGRENYPTRTAHKTFSPEFVRWEIQQEALIFHYKTNESSTKYGDAKEITLRIEFPKKDDTIHITLKLTNKQETPFVESGSFVIPFVNGTSWQIGKPGGIVNPQTDIQDCCNHALFNLERQVTAYTKEGSVSICSPDAPLFGIGSTGVYEYHKTFGTRGSDVYFNLFNNMWGTNFPQWIGGDLEYHFILQSDVENPQVWAAKACQEMIDLQERFVKQSEEAFMVIPAGMELVRTQVEKGVIYVTFRDLVGKATTGSLSITGASIQPVDFNHNPTQKAQPNCCLFAVRPYGLHCFAVTIK